MTGGQAGVVVNCGACGASNRENAKFCAECGAAQSSVCAACGHDLRGGAKFCDECGSAVEATRPPAEPPSAAEAVRKTVTVLFCDLVGSTAFGEQVDPESARDAMGRYFAMAQTTVEAHEGTVAKFIGDGVMAVFGIPEVAEDDADRAIATGLALQRNFEPIRAHIASRYGVDVGLRVGINTGEVAVAHDDADIVGDALNTAARLEAACTPGRVLVGEDTWRLTRSRVTYEVLGEVRVKGKAAPVATFQVVDERVDEDELATPFVGREAELAELRRVYASACTERAAKLATVIGAPGVGKTRLARELTRTHKGDSATFDLRCERSGTTTFAPVAQLLRTAAGIESDSERAESLQALEELIPSEAVDRSRVIELLGSFVGVSEARSTEELFFAVRRLLEILATDRPTLVVVDDIQWAEPLFLDLLEHLVEWVRDAPLTIVALARPEIRDTRPAFGEAGRRVTSVLPLEGLDAAATQQLASELLGAGTLPAELTARLPVSTEGNPLFVRELVRMLVDDGVVTRTGESWEMTVDAESVEVPPTIQSLLSTRVERMPDDERRFVELASVVGTEFPRGAVASLLGDDEAETIATTVERLRRKEIIEPTGSYWGDEPIFRFHHVLIRDAAYRRLLKRARADLHLQVAEWTEERSADLVGEFEPTIAFHFEQCHAYRLELGLADAETAGIGDRAAALLHTAAARALERDDLGAAGSLSRRALDVLAPDAPSRNELLLLACESLLSSGDVIAGERALHELEAVTGDPRLEAWAACLHGQLITLSAPEELSFAEASVGAAAERLARMGDDAGVAKARQVRAGALARLGRVGDCEAELDLALTAARAADDRRRVTAVLGSAPTAALWGPSPVPRAGGRCLDVIRLLRITSGSPAVEATSVRCQAVLEGLRGRFDTARTMLETSRASAEELGLAHGLMETELYAGIVELLAGDAAAAEPHLRLAYDGLEKLGIGADAGQAAAHLARALLVQGQLDEADELAAASDALAGQNPQTIIASRSVQAEILAARGEHARATQLAEEAVALATGRDIVVDHANANLALARVRRAAGDLPGAELAHAEAMRLFDLKGATVAVAHSPLPLPETSPIRAPDKPGGAASMGAPTSTIENGMTRQAQRFIGLLRAGERAALAEVVHPDIERSDRRHGVAGPPIHGRDAYLDAVMALRDLGFDDLRADPAAVHGERYAVVELVIRTSDGAELRHYMAFEGDDSLQATRVALFDLDDLDAAEAQLAAWAADTDVRRDGGDSPPSDTVSGGGVRRALHNTATRVSDRLSDLGRRGRFADLEAAVHPDAVAADHALLGGGVGGRAEFVQGMRSWRDVWADDVDRGGPVAIRGDRLALMEYRFGTQGDWSIDRLAVVEVDENELLVYINFYDPIHRAEAFDELLRRHLAGEGAAHEAVLGPLVEFTRCMNALDIDGALALCADDFRTVDHTPLSWEPQDRDEFADRIRMLPELAEEYSDMMGAIFRVGAGAVLGTRETAVTARNGTETEASELGLFVVRDGLIRRYENFSLDQLDDAVARFDELEARSPRAPRLVNAATRNGHRHVVALLAAGDSDAWADIVAPDFVLDDRRSTVNAGVVSGDAAVEATLAPFVDLKSIDGIDARAVAIRGDDLALVRVAFDVDGFEMAFLAVEVADQDGRRARTVMFDADDLRAAVAELDKLHLERLDGLRASMYRECLYFDQIWMAGDVDRAIAFMHPECTVVDHRPLGFGPESDIRDRVTSMIEAADEFFVFYVEIHCLNRRRWCASRRYLLQTPDGGEFRQDVLQVTELDPVTALVKRVDQFGPDQVDEAIALCSERARADADLPANWATQQSATLDRYARTGDLDRFVDFVAPGCVFTDVDKSRRVISADMVRAGDPSITDLGFGAAARELVAARGDHLGLTRTGTPVGLLALHEIDERGRLVRIAHYPSGQAVDVVALDADLLGPVIAELDSLHASTVEGRSAALQATVGTFTVPENEAARVAQRYLEAIRSDDQAGIARWIAADVEAVDHRRTVADVPITDRETFVHAYHGATEVGLDDFAGAPLAIRGDRLLLAEVTSSSPDGFEVGYVVVFVLNEHGQLQAQLEYEPDQLAVAFDELNRRYLDDEGAHLASMLRTKFACDTALNHHDIATLSSLMPDRLRVIDHRPLGFGELDKRGLMEYLEAAPSVAGPRVHGAAQFHAVTPQGHVVTSFVGSVSDGRFGGARWDHTDVIVGQDDELRIEYFPVGEVEQAMARFRALSAAVSPQV